ncbi:MAG: sugar porter family MFS transporter [Chitinophagales bacterium]
MNKNNNNKTLFWSITVALAGFLFGFDTIVISGADQPIQKLWNTSPWFHSTFIMSMALWGTVIGALFGGIPCKYFGRKKTLLWIGILYTVSAFGSGLATDPYIFSFFRFIGGLGVGASSVAAPIYISEIVPAKNRGRMVALYQFNIVFGILVAFFSNYFIGQSFDGATAWRYMLGVEAIPALIYTLMVFGVPNSPRWLILQKNDEATARGLLEQLNPGENVQQLINDIKKSVEASTAKSVGFFSGKYNTPILLAFLLAFFNQASGINFVLYYAPRIFSEAGIENVLGASVPIGVVNLLFTILGMYLIDRVGRKTLMLWGSIGYIATLLGVAYAFYSGVQGVPVVALICAFVGSHAIGQGAVIWVFISEIFPNKVRDYGMSLGSGTHWVFAALITMITLPVLTWLGDSNWMIYVFFAAMMGLQLLFVLFMMPETKGVSLEELEKEMMK